jgi:hypothetical protein
VVAVDRVRPRLELLYAIEGLLVTLPPGERPVEHLDLPPQERAF